MPVTLIRRLFASSRSPQKEGPTDYQSLGQAADGLHAEYQRIIELQMKRWGVSETCASVEVHQVGKAADGREVFVGAVRLHAWDRKPALRLLLGLPLLEAKVRKTIRAHWLAEVSHFSGLWLHASEKLQGTAASGELRSLVVALTGPRAQAGLRSERADGSRPMRL